MLTNKDLQNINKLIALEIDPLKQEVLIIHETMDELVTGMDGVRKILDEQEYAIHAGYTFKK